MIRVGLSEIMSKANNRRKILKDRYNFLYKPIINREYISVIKLFYIKGESIMNAYLVPISTNKSKNFNYLRLCFASSEKEAYIQTNKNFLLMKFNHIKEIPYDTFDINFLV